MALVALAVVVPALSMTEQADFRIIWPSGEEMLLLTGVGIIGTFGHLLMTAAVRFTPSATLAPMQYLEIPFATLIGLAHLLRVAQPARDCGHSCDDLFGHLHDLP